MHGLLCLEMSCPLQWEQSTCSSPWTNVETKLATRCSESGATKFVERTRRNTNCASQDYFLDDLYRITDCSGNENVRVIVNHIVDRIDPVIVVQPAPMNQTGKQRPRVSQGYIVHKGYRRPAV